MLSTLLKSLLITASVLLLSACGLGEDKKDPETYQPAEETWSINDVSLTCGDPSMCPDNQGIIMAVKRSTSYSYWGSTTSLGIGRCTGTIYDAHHVITAGHCVDGFSSAQEIWFKTVSKPGRPSRIFHVNSTPAAREWEGGRDFWRTDYASIELTEDASGVAFARPALTAPGTPNKMVALVINSATGTSNEMKRFELDAKTCNHSVTSKNPITYDMNPTKYMITGCRIIGGNSGGSIVEPSNLLSVLGIVSASNGPKAEDAYRVPYNSSIDGDQYEYGIITNARCVSAPGWPKTSESCMDMSNAIREQAVQMALMKSKPVVVDTPKATEDPKPSSREQARKLVQDFFDGPNSFARTGSAKIQFLPEIVPMRYSEFAKLKFATGFNIVPIPMCITGDIPKGVTRTLILKTGAYSIDADGNTGDVDPGLDPMIYVDVKSLGGGRYQFKYGDISDIMLKYLMTTTPSPAGRYRKLKDPGDEVVLSQCTGSEKKAFLN